VAPGGVLLQFHSLATILWLGQWNLLRHGHYGQRRGRLLGPACWRRPGFVPRQAWRSDLYAGPCCSPPLVAMTVGATPTPAVIRPEALATCSLRRPPWAWDPARVRALHDSVVSRAEALHRRLVDQKEAECTVLGYGAALRAVALLCRAGVDCSLLPSVAAASAAQQGRRMPATDIPVIATAEVAAARPDAVVLSLSDLLPEMRVMLPDVEAAGARLGRRGGAGPDAQPASAAPFQRSLSSASGPLQRAR
jgi:C-methyltransferase C-terminal domain